MLRKRPVRGRDLALPSDPTPLMTAAGTDRVFSERLRRRADGRGWTRALVYKPVTYREHAHMCEASYPGAEVCEAAAVQSSVGLSLGLLEKGGEDDFEFASTLDGASHSKCAPRSHYEPPTVNEKTRAVSMNAKDGSTALPANLLSDNGAEVHRTSCIDTVQPPSYNPTLPPPSPTTLCQ